MKPNILLIDDERAFLEIVKEFLEEGNKYKVFEAENGAQALAILRESRIDIVLLDILLGKLSGIDLLPKIREFDPHVPIIMETAVGEFEAIRKCMRWGIFDYHVKPFRLEELLRSVASALRKNQRRTSSANDKYFERYGMIGGSAVMLEVYERIEKLCKSSPILVTGPTGVGKELVARALHRLGPRADKPFIIVNCGAIAEGIIESELFGHEKGAFSGAIALHIGFFEKAKGGTLFLDEIGEMSPASQVKLLRVLQDGEFQRVGRTETLHSDAFVYSASNRDLPEMIRMGKFREDLYYRIKNLEIKVPPLSDRRDDIPLLVEYFSRKYINQPGISIGKLTGDAIRRLQNHTWRGNIRELESAVYTLFIEGEAALAENAKEEVTGSSGDLKDELRRDARRRLESLDLTMKNFRLLRKTFNEEYSAILAWEFLSKLKSQYHGTITRVAEISEIGRENIYDLMQLAGIRREEMKNWFDD